MARKVSLTINDALEARIESKIEQAALRGGRLTMADVIRDAIKMYLNRSDDCHVCQHYESISAAPANTV